MALPKRFNSTEQTLALLAKELRQRQALLLPNAEGVEELVSPQ